jgi:hypothetical protein
MSDSAATLHFSSPPPPGASTFPFCRSSCMCLFFLAAALRARRCTRSYREDTTVTHCTVHFAYHSDWQFICHRCVSLLQDFLLCPYWSVEPAGHTQFDLHQEMSIKKSAAYPNSENHGEESIFRSCKLHCLLQKLEVQCKVNKHTQLLPILCQLNPVYTLIPTCSVRWAISLLHNADCQQYILTLFTSTLHVPCHGATGPTEDIRSSTGKVHPMTYHDGRREEV